jgi:hypothetical protein
MEEAREELKASDVEHTIEVPGIWGFRVLISGPGFRVSGPGFLFQIWGYVFGV